MGVIEEVETYRDWEAMRVRVMAAGLKKVFGWATTGDRKSVHVQLVSWTGMLKGR